MPGKLGSLNLTNIMQGIIQVAKVMQGGLVVWTNGFVDTHLWFASGSALSSVAKDNVSGPAGAGYSSTLVDSILADKEFVYAANFDTGGSIRHTYLKIRESDGTLAVTGQASTSYSIFSFWLGIVGDYIYASRYHNTTDLLTIEKISKVTMLAVDVYTYTTATYTASHAIQYGGYLIVFNGRDNFTLDTSDMTLVGALRASTGSELREQQYHTDGVHAWSSQNAGHDIGKFPLNDPGNPIEISLALEHAYYAPIVGDDTYLFTYAEDSGGVRRLVKYDKATMTEQARGTVIMTKYQWWYDVDNGLIYAFDNDDVDIFNTSCVLVGSHTAANFDVGQSISDGYDQQDE